MYRVGLLKNDGTNEVHNFNTKEECENWILDNIHKCAIKKAIILNLENRNDKEIITF